MKDKFSKLVASVQTESKAAIATVDSAIQTTKDTVLDAVDESVSAVKKTYAQVTETLETFAAIGVTLALIVAPVPTAVALAMMWLMEQSITAKKRNIDYVTSMKKNDREFKRVTGLLKKHGLIPQTAIVQTEYLKLEIDSEKNSITGVVLKGANTGMRLNDMDDQTLELFRNAAPDNDTRDLMDAYMSFIKSSQSTD